MYDDDASVLLRRLGLVLDVAVAADVAGRGDVDVAREVGLRGSREMHAVATVAGSHDPSRDNRSR
jgi:hypothetical protein